MVTIRTAVLKQLVRTLISNHVLEHHDLENMIVSLRLNASKDDGGVSENAAQLLLDWLLKLGWFRTPSLAAVSTGPNPVAV